MAFFLMFAGKAFALEYIPLTTVGTEITKGTAIEPTEYAKGLFNFMLGLAVFLAVIKIVIGGIKIMVNGDSPGKITEAKDDITQAIYGMLLAIGAIFILNLIGKDITNTDFLKELK